MTTPNIMDRFNSFFERARRKNEEAEEEMRVEEQKEAARVADLYRWASDDVASIHVLPLFESIIDRLEREQADNVENHAKMTMLQGRILAVKDIRRMFHEWRRLDA